MNLPSPDDRDADTAYDELADAWPTDRPSRRRRAREQRRAKTKRVTVRAVRREQADVEHMSRALLAAHRDFAHAQAERDAQSTNDTKRGADGSGDDEERS